MLSDLFVHVLSLSISATIVIFLVFIVRSFLCSSPKIYSYILWSIVLVKLLVPFSIESEYSIVPDTSRIVENISTISETKPTLKNSQNVNQVVVESNNNVSNEINENENIDISNRVDFKQNEKVNNVTRGENTLTYITEIFSIVWILGVLFLILKSMFDLQKLNKSLSNADLYRDNIYFSNKISTAFVLGFVKPKIYIPKAIAENVLDYIIKHEVIHIKRKDHVFRLLGYIALCIHWFNPFVWLAYSKSSKDMEMSCDERVLKELGTDIKKDYSTTLLAIATNKNSLKVSTLAFAENNTKERIKNVLSYKKQKFCLAALSVLIVLVSGVVLLTSPKSNDVVKDVLDELYLKNDNLVNIEMQIFEGYGSLQIPKEDYEEFNEFIRNIEIDTSDNMYGAHSSKMNGVINYTFIDEGSTNKYIVEQPKLAVTIFIMGDFDSISIHDVSDEVKYFRILYPDEVKSGFDKWIERSSKTLMSTSPKDVDNSSNNLKTLADAVWDVKSNYNNEKDNFDDLISLLPLSIYATNSTSEILEGKDYATTWNSAKINFEDNKGASWIIETEEDYIDSPEMYQSVRLIFATLEDIDDIQIAANNTVYDYENTYIFRRVKFEEIYGDSKRANSGNREDFSKLIYDINNTDYYATDVYETAIFDGIEGEMRQSSHLYDSRSTTFDVITTYPKEFPPNVAAAYYNFVVTPREEYNRDLFDDFIENVELGKIIHLYLTEYTKEGDPIVTSVRYYESGFDVVIDTRRDEYGTKTITEKTYKNLVKYTPKDTAGIVDYYLTDKETITEEDIKNGFNGRRLYREEAK